MFSITMFTVWNVLTSALVLLSFSGMPVQPRISGMSDILQFLFPLDLEVDDRIPHFCISAIRAASSCSRWMWFRRSGSFDGSVGSLRSAKELLHVWMTRRLLARRLCRSFGRSTGQWMPLRYDHSSHRDTVHEHGARRDQPDSDVRRGVYAL